MPDPGPGSRTSSHRLQDTPPGSIHVWEEIHTPDLRIVLPTARLPEDQTFMWMLDEDAVAWQLSAIVDESLVLGAHQTGVPSSDDKSFVSFQPSDLEDVELGALRADIGDVARYRSTIELALDSCHCLVSSFNEVNNGYGSEQRDSQGPCGTGCT